MLLFWQSLKCFSIVGAVLFKLLWSFMIAFKYKLRIAWLLIMLWLFVCFCFFVALRPMSTAMVIAGRSVHLTTLFPGQA